MLRENADLLSSLLLCLPFFSLSFLGSLFRSALLYSCSSVHPPSLPDCNNSNNDNNGDRPGDGDVKKHNIRITNTLSNQWPSFDLCACECVCTCVHTLPWASETQTFCVWESWGVRRHRKTETEREFAGMLYIRSLPLQFKQSRLCWQPPLLTPNGLHHV